MTLKWKLFADGELVQTEAAGGFEGVHVSFGENCDLNTFEQMFPSPYVLRISSVDEDFDVASGHYFTRNEDGYVILRARRNDDQANGPVGDEFSTLIDDIIAVHVY